MTGYRLCDNCALKYADCKGNKDKEKCRCDYYKKPVVMNVKELAERVAELEAMANRYKWIPVTERLPKYNQLVLVTVNDDFDIENKIIITDGEYANRHTMHWKAWMPLPEPYKEV